MLEKYIYKTCVSAVCISIIAFVVEVSVSSVLLFSISFYQRSHFLCPPPPNTETLFWLLYTVWRCEIYHQQECEYYEFYS